MTQGLQQSMIPPGAQGLRNYNVNIPGAVDATWLPLYDFQTYAAAGQTSLNFFAVPNGQSSKTIEDTNMVVAGQLAAPINMLVTSVSVDFFPGNSPAEFGAQAAEKFWNDVWTALKWGSLKFTVGDKVVCQDAPLIKFPPRSRLDGTAALADVTTAGADLQSRIGYAASSGYMYAITPVRIPSSQNFKVLMEWGTVRALPSTTAGRIGVTLNGFQYRLAQ